MKPQRTLFQKLLAEGTLVGSRAWGGSTETSDWDVVMSDSDFDAIIEQYRDTNFDIMYYGGTSNNKVRKLRNNKNVKIYVLEGVVNVMTYNVPELHTGMLQVHYAMLAMADTEVGRLLANNKKSRCAVVECLATQIFLLTN